MHIFEQLAAPFPVESIHWRVGATTRDKSKGIALAYLDARDCMDRLNEVVGPAHWQDEHVWSDGSRLCCRVGIRFDGEWIWKSDGAGDTDYEAEKGAFSSAFKRACVKWGIGQYLYSLPNSWYPIEQFGKSCVFSNETKSKLNQDLINWQNTEYKKQMEVIRERSQAFTYRAAALEALTPTANQIKESIQKDDPAGVWQLWDELSVNEKEVMWTAVTKGGFFNTNEKEFITNSRPTD